jgi:2-oxo-4-hydroxy-4-carboxy-5-ureidoimidazoline decarboxylase
VTLAALNACECRAFVDAVGWVFEHSPWVAERAWPSRPFASLDAVHNAMVAVAAAASRDEQLALLRAHPDLGARARMTASSTSEQSGAGLDRLSPAQYERLQQLNGAYREKFGFPFLFAVNGSTVDQILAALDARLPRAWAEEFDEAMRQASRIARFRLDAVITD